MEKRYFEIEFDHDKRSRDTDDCIGDYSTCIIGTRKPTYEEAEAFCKSEMEETGHEYVVGITEISEEDARAFFSEEQEEDLPTFS